jgi:integrase
MPGHKLSPVTAVKNAFDLTCTAPVTGPAFVLQDKAGFRPLLYKAFVKKLKSSLQVMGLDPKLYSSHSLRRGGATWAARVGLTGDVIQMLGDWQSDAYLLYLSIPMSSKIGNMVEFYNKLPNNSMDL